jgi:CubicO group peptidase (beta-lactamase class C family)
MTMRVSRAALLAFVAAISFGCTSQYFGRLVTWRGADPMDYRRFPSRPLTPSPRPFFFARGGDETRVRAAFRTANPSDSLDAFLARNGTQAFLVIQDDTILYEHYFNGTGRDSIVTSFSVAKSFASALIGKAIDEGYIHSVDDPITRYLPELAARDERFGRITIRDLLMMASGIHFGSGFLLVANDDARTYYLPDLRRGALQSTWIERPPRERFEYNNYHPLLLGMILERVTGRHVTDYLQEKIWEPLGMEFGGSWSLDSRKSGFEKMESGLNARAIDFAKFGRLFLNNGSWNGTQVLPASWVLESTRPDTTLDYHTYYPAEGPFARGGGYYKYFWWGLRDNEGYDFTGVGNFGQYIYVSPASHLIIVRNGESLGSGRWLGIFQSMARALRR